jgi:hypothetical protein
VCRLVKRLPQNPLTDKEKLAAAEFQLRTLVDLGREFSTNFDPARVASIALASLMGHLTILRAAFLTSTPDGKVRVLASRGVKNVKTLEGIPWADVEGEGNSTETPAAALKVLRLDFIFRFSSGEEKGAILFSQRLSGGEFGEGERNLIHAVGRQALAALTGARARKCASRRPAPIPSFRSRARSSRVCFPRCCRAIPGFDVAASSEACFSVGGDLFDVIPLFASALRHHPRRRLGQGHARRASSWPSPMPRFGPWPAAFPPSTFWRASPNSFATPTSRIATPPASMPNSTPPRGRSGM